MQKTILVLALVALLVACSPPQPETRPAPTLKPVEAATATPTVAQIATPLNTPQPTVTVESKPTAAPTATLGTSPAVGLGVTRADAARLYQLFEFNFATKTDEQGQENYIGTVSDNLAVVRLTGPKESIKSASIVITVSKPPTSSQSSRTMAYLATLLTVATKDWSEGTTWLNSSLNKIGESRATFDGREAVLVVTPKDSQTVVEFTIRAK